MSQIVIIVKIYGGIASVEQDFIAVTERERKMWINRINNFEQNGNDFQKPRGQD
jgi:hypothetical protein